MINAIELINFQSHKHTYLELSKGLNIIKGESHEGKSSIIRAIHWASMNRPVGVNYLSWFAKEKDATSISIEFDTGKKDDEGDDEVEFITRTKGVGVNTYECSNVLDEFTALRSDVPEEISSITRMNGINIQVQESDRFMLNSTPGEVAKKFNELLGLSIIDKTFANIGSKISTIASQIKTYKSDLKDAKRKLPFYDFIDDIQRMIDDIDELHSKRDEAYYSCIELEDLVREERRQINIKTEATNLLKNESKIDEAIELLNEKDKIFGQINSLKQHIREIKQLEDFISNMELKTSGEYLIDEGLEIRREMNDIDFSKDAIQKLISDINSAKKTEREANGLVESTKKAINELTKDMKICPECGQPI